MYIPKIEAPDSATQFVMDNLFGNVEIAVQSFISDIYDQNGVETLPGTFYSITNMRRMWESDIPALARNECIEAVKRHEDEDIDLLHQMFMYVGEADYRWLCTLAAERLMLLGRGYEGYEKFVQEMGTRLGTVNYRTVIMKVDYD